VQLQQLSSFGSRLDTAWTAVNQRKPGCANTSAGSGGGNQVAGIVERESATLQIRTTEGDLVTLSLREKSSLSLSGTQDQSGAGASLTAVSHGRLQVDVSGNLNASELQAIGAVLSQVDALATKFFSGDIQGAFSAAASIGSDPAQIAGFSLQLSYSSLLYQGSVSGVGPAATQPVADLLRNRLSPLRRRIRPRSSPPRRKTPGQQQARRRQQTRRRPRRQPLRPQARSRRLPPSCRMFLPSSAQPLTRRASVSPCVGSSRCWPSRCRPMLRLRRPRRRRRRPSRRIP
jgi:hypothetical protein